jgi:hypothetical protein
VTRLGASGVPIDTLMRAGGRRAFTAELRKEWLDQLAARGRDDAQRAQLRAFFEDFPTPDSLPAYDRVLAGGDGSVWVRGFPPPGAPNHEWTVFDEQGRWLGEVVVPAEVDLVDVSVPYAVALEQDPAGLERVVVYRLDRGATTTGLVRLGMTSGTGTRGGTGTGVLTRARAPARAPARCVPSASDDRCTPPG